MTYIVVYTDFAGQLRHVSFAEPDAAETFINDLTGSCYLIECKDETRLHDLTDLRKKHAWKPA